MKQKTGILLLQLGTPDSPSTRDVRTYLREFLSDPRVIDLPWIARTVLVNGIIAPFRAPKSAKIYRELWQLGSGRSPLLTHTENTRTRLQERMDVYAAKTGATIDVEMAMRYQNPSMESVLARMHQAAYDRIIILPLFPQYASASTGSAIEKAFDIMRRWWVIPHLDIVSQFYDHDGYLDSIVDRAAAFDLGSYDHILFSYHGLPERHVDKVYNEGLCSDRDCEHEITGENGWCYKATCYATTRLLAEKLGLHEDRYTVTFQSRLSKKWIEPFSDKVLEQLAQKGAKRVLVFSPAFVADCLETLIEIGSEYQTLFRQHGGETVDLVPSSNDHPRFIDCLESLVLDRLS